MNYFLAEEKIFSMYNCISRNICTSIWGRHLGNCFDLQNEQNAKTILANAYPPRHPKYPPPQKKKKKKRRRRRKGVFNNGSAAELRA